MAGHPYIPHNIDKILETKKRKEGKWGRKPESEIDRIKIEIKQSRYSLVMPIGMFLVSMFGCHVTMNMISRSRLSVGLVISAAVFILTFAVQVISGRALARSPRFRICRGCLKEDWIGLKQCHCGGELDPPDYYHFIEKSNE